MLALKGKKKVCKDRKNFLKMHGHQCKAIRIMKNQANMPLLQEINTARVTDPKEMEINKSPDKELKIIVLKKLIEL